MRIGSAQGQSQPAELFGGRTVFLRSLTWVLLGFPRSGPGGLVGGGALAQVACEERCCCEKPVREAAEGWGVGEQAGRCCHLPGSAPSRRGSPCGRRHQVVRGPEPAPCMSLGGDHSGSQPKEWVWEMSRAGAFFGGDTVTGQGGSGLSRWARARGRQDTSLAREAE